MAKGNLFLSQARGKVGSVVFSRVDGKQVTRVYTDQVKNPKSEAQNLQRAIFYSVQRMAAGAKYLVEQGQEGVATGYKSRRAFVKKALNDLRAAVLNGQLSTLNVKGNPYMQAIPVSLTNGSLAAPTYGYKAVGGDGDTFLPSTVGGVAVNTTMTLAELFAAVPQLGLGKQLTMVWLLADVDPNLEDEDVWSQLNYKTSLHYSEIVFADNEEVLNLPAFVENESSVRVFNPAVLAPSWGGTDAFPGTDMNNVDHLAMKSSVVAFAYIISDYTNNRWSRSYSPFSINPLFATDPYLVAETYAADTTAKGSDQYLDQGDASTPTAEENPRMVQGNVGGLTGTSWNLTNNLAKTISVPVSQSDEIDVSVYPKKTGYTEDSVAVSFSGTASTFAPSGEVVLVPTSYGDAWTCNYEPSTAPTAGQTTIMTIKVGTITRTLTINWIAD